TRETTAQRETWRKSNQRAAAAAAAAGKRANNGWRPALARWGGTQRQALSLEDVPK
ncbi:unnamed protein product, partial [Ectocarpus fasciculatus]